MKPVNHNHSKIDPTAQDGKPLLSSDLMVRLSALQLKALRVVEGVVTGLHKSRHHGASIEFAEHKEYAPGDEIRHIDWKAFGRFDKYYVKRFEEETNLRAFLAIDTSGSMGYASAGRSKLDYGLVLAAALGYILLRQQDAVGLITTGPDPIYLPPRSRTSHFHELLAALVGLRPQGGTDMQDLVNRLSDVAGKRSLIILLSDLLDPSSQAPGVIKQLQSRRHELVVFHLMDHGELTFPFDDPAMFQSMEEELRLEVHPRAIRREYLHQLEGFLARWRGVCLESDAEYHLIDTALVSEGDALFALLKGRGQRKRGRL